SPCPNISETKLAAQVQWHVLFFRVTETPNFVALDSLAWKVAHRPILEFLTGRAENGHKALNGVFGSASHSNVSSNRIALNKCGNYLGTFFMGELIHTGTIIWNCQNSVNDYSILLSEY